MNRRRDVARLGSASRSLLYLSLHWKHESFVVNHCRSPLPSLAAVSVLSNAPPPYAQSCRSILNTTTVLSQIRPSLRCSDVIDDERNCDVDGVMNARRLAIADVDVLHCRGRLELNARSVFHSVAMYSMPHVQWSESWLLA